MCVVHFYVSCVEGVCVWSRASVCGVKKRPNLCSGLLGAFCKASGGVFGLVSFNEGMVVVGGRDVQW